MNWFFTYPMPRVYQAMAVLWDWLSTQSFLLEVFIHGAFSCNCEKLKEFLSLSVNLKRDSI